MATVREPPEFAGWHVWKGVAWWYASRRSSPRRTVRARHRRHLRSGVVLADRPDRWELALGAQSNAVGELARHITQRRRFEGPLPL